MGGFATTWGNVLKGLSVEKLRQLLFFFFVFNKDLSIWKHLTHFFQFLLLQPVRILSQPLSLSVVGQGCCVGLHESVSTHSSFSQLIFVWTLRHNTEHLFNSDVWLLDSALTVAPVSVRTLGKAISFSLFLCESLDGQRVSRPSGAEWNLSGLQTVTGVLLITGLIMEGRVLMQVRDSKIPYMSLVITVLWTLDHVAHSVIHVLNLALWSL